jgi:hypothetical protein
LRWWGGRTGSDIDSIDAFAKCDNSGRIKQQKKSLTTVAPKVTTVGRARPTSEAAMDKERAAAIDARGEPIKINSVTK